MGERYAMSSLCQCLKLSVCAALAFVCLAAFNPASAQEPDAPLELTSPATTETLQNAAIDVMEEAPSTTDLQQAAQATTVTPGLAEAAVPVPGARSLVFVLPIHGEITKATHLIVVRAMREAETQGADAIVLDMDTPGGEVFASIHIRDELIAADVPTYAYVNPMAISAGAFLSLATDKIIMGQNSSIGGALPITMQAEGARGADEKFISIFNAEMRKTAKTKGHPVDIAMGFCDPDTVIPGLKEQGEILTLDFDQATSVGLSPYQALTMESMLDREGLGNAQVVWFEETAFDTLARFFSSPQILGILMMIGLAGIWIEIKTPGVGVPGAVGLAAIALTFFGSYLANLSSYVEWVIFFLGVVLVIIEIYVIPGFGIIGITGLVLMIGSLFFSMVNLAPGDGGFDLTALRLDMLITPAATLTFVILGMIPLFYLVAKFLPATSVYGFLVLTPDQPQTAMAGGPAAEAAAVETEVEEPPSPLVPGARGTAVTDLYPTGVAMIEGRRVDVLTEGEFIDRGRPVEIIRLEGNRIFVSSAEE